MPYIEFILKRSRKKVTVIMYRAYQKRPQIIIDWWCVCLDSVSGRFPHIVINKLILYTIRAYIIHQYSTLSKQCERQRALYRCTYIYSWMQFIIQTCFIERKMTIVGTYFQSDFFYFSKFQFCSFWRTTEDNKRHPCWNKLSWRAIYIHVCISSREIIHVLI